MTLYIDSVEKLFALLLIAFYLGTEVGDGLNGGNHDTRTTDEAPHSTRSSYRGI